jgi:glycosyltransferase involved in cell wall biosynthesis
VISVCLAAYNGERFIEPQVRSILQSNHVSELLISDDGSTDATREVVGRIGDSRIRLLAGPRQGVARNVQFLLERSGGDLIFLADQDDVWLPRKVEVMVSVLQHADLAVSDCGVVNETLQELHSSYFRLRGSGGGLLRNLLRNSYLGCCMAFRRSLLRRALPFPDDVPMHDWWLGLVAERFGSVAFVDEPLVLYRRHDSNLTPSAERSSTSWMQRLKWRAALAGALLARR